MNSSWAKLFVRSLAKAGVTDVVVCPGSRSTPLVLAADADPDLRTHPVLDERAAAFFALGLARASGRAALLVCTSGTAGGHALPAILEAEQSFLPLLVVTADRPAELHDCRAPQTVEQVRLFGDHVRHFVDLGPPDPHPMAIRALPRIATQCVLATRWPVPGPVHANIRFRKPLEPTGIAVPEEIAPLLDAPPIEVFPPEPAPDPRAIERLLDALRGTGRGVIACGWSDLSRRDAAAVGSLAALSGFALLAETTSQLRVRGIDAFHGFDTFLRAPSFRARVAPEVVIELGAPPISEGYQIWLAEHPPRRRFVVAPYRWGDPGGGATGMVFADPGAVARTLVARLPQSHAPDDAWRADLARADAIVWEEVERELGSHRTLIEGHVARAVVEGAPEGSILAVGNSLPLRDADTFARAPATPVRVLHQRGCNGIDGLVAGAAGAQVASRIPLTLLCGDGSFLHDLSSLAIARHAPGPLVFVVVQNDGGRIFEELPLAQDPALAAAIERLLTMPQGLDLARAARLYDVEHERVDSPAALGRALSRAHARRGASVIEAVVDPKTSSAARRSVRAAVAARLQAP